MKKMLLLFAASLMAGGVSAQEAESLIVDVENTWNIEAIVETTASPAISFSQANAEYSVISSISADEYKGCKVEFSDLSGKVQLKIQDGSGNGNYPKFYDEGVVTGNVLTKEFVNLTGTISTFNVQAEEAGASIKIDKFILIKTDGTEQVLTSTVGPVWGCSADYGTILGLKFLGQWGGALIKTEDGSNVTYDPETEKNVVYTYTIELDEAAPGEVLIEPNATFGQWGLNFTIAKGQDKVVFDISAEAVGTNVMSSLYIKGNEDPKQTPSTYPYSIKFKSITRTKKTTALNLPSSDASVVSSQYISLSGKVSNEPQQGLNIVKQTLSDGSVRYIKALNK